MTSFQVTQKPIVITWILFLKHLKGSSNWKRKMFKRVTSATNEYLTQNVRLFSEIFASVTFSKQLSFHFLEIDFGSRFKWFTLYMTSYKMVSFSTGSQDNISTPDSACTANVNSSGTKLLPYRCKLCPLDFLNKRAIRYLAASSGQAVYII